MAEPTRRDLLAGSGLIIAAGSMPAMAASDPEAGQTAADLDRYIGFGIKASGGPGDNASGAWIEDRLRRAGYKVDRQPFDAPFFEIVRAELSAGSATAPVIPQAIVIPTGEDGVTGRLVRVDPIAGASSVLTNAIALVDLPYNRWSSALAKPIMDTARAALAGGAVAAAIITNGPTRKAIALNADGKAPMFDKPVAVLAPDQAAPFLVAAAKGESATLRVTGTAGRRSAYNLIGKIDRGKGRWIVLSTPRSGWFTCAGERGPGIAAWLALARWAPAALPDHDIALLCNSGHEYEYLGAEKALAALAPPSADTAFWLHLGANVAARDWQEMGGGILLPLPSADPQRFLVTSPALVEPARRTFAGQPGLESAYPAGQGSAGELTNILAVGYGRVAGIFGAHRFHHVAGDDSSCVSPLLVDRAIAACKQLIIASVG
jgi:hypothetical protein